MMYMIKPGHLIREHDCAMGLALLSEEPKSNSVTFYDSPDIIYTADGVFNNQNLAIGAPFHNSLVKLKEKRT